MKWKRANPFWCVCVCLFLTVCYSDHQGQASAKRQGKFKKVLDKLETLNHRVPTSHLPSGSGSFLLFIASFYLCFDHLCIGLRNMNYFCSNVQIFWWSVPIKIRQNMDNQKRVRVMIWTGELWMWDLWINRTVDQGSLCVCLHRILFQSSTTWFPLPTKQRTVGRKRRRTRRETKRRMWRRSLQRLWETWKFSGWQSQLLLEPHSWLIFAEILWNLNYFLVFLFAQVRFQLSLWWTGWTLSRLPSAACAEAASAGQRKGKSTAEGNLTISLKPSPLRNAQKWFWTKIVDLPHDDGSFLVC